MLSALVSEPKDGSRATVVRLRGDIDIACRDALRRMLYDAADANERPLVVSLEDCPYCDCSTLGVLGNVRNSIGPRLRVVVPLDHPTRRIFALTELLEELDVVPTVARALADQASPNARIRELDGNLSSTRAVARGSTGSFANASSFVAG